MANKHTKLQTVDSQGQQVSLNHTSTDSPLLPAANLQQLHTIDPKLVTWVVEQTEIEANARRAQERRVDWFIFAERMSGVLAGALVAIGGLAISAYVVLQGHDWAGALLGGATLGTIVTALVTKQRAANSVETQSAHKPIRKPPVKTAPSQKKLRSNRPPQE